MSQSPTSDPSWKGLPSWLVFTFLVIAPPAAFVAFVRSMNPVVVASLILAYELLLFIGRFAGKIWQPLEESLTKYIAHWLTIRIQEWTSQYYRRYCHYMVYENQVFDVKGLSTRTAHDLELERVFVDLRINPMPPHKASIDPLQLPKSLQGTHSIWDYLSNTDLANPHFVVLGAPGSGKTTLLKHLALTLAQPKKYPRRLGMRHTFPILLFLRDHARTILEQPDFSLAKAIQDHIQRTWQQTVPTTWISRYLEARNCLILLDGLDEVADSSTRKLVVAWVQRQLITYGGNRFVLTSRPYGYRDNPLDGVTVLDVQTFTPDQVEQFVRNWYLANELKSWGKDDPGVHLRARQGNHDLLQRLHQTPALLELAVNPLLLTMITTVHRERSSLPGKRVNLYEEICEVFLGKRHEARGITQLLSPAQKQQVLQSLAYSLMQQGIRDIECEKAQHFIAPALALVNPQMRPTDFLSLIQDTSGLFLERNPGFYGFAHLTFQEYLAAVHIKEEGLEQILVAQVTNSWWHETIRLYCAQADATALILACLAGTPPAVAALVLAFECDKEKLKIQPHAQSQVDMVLEAGVEDHDQMRRCVIAEALLTRRLRRMIHLRQNTYIDTSLITCAEYQVFLDERRAESHYHQPDHWPMFSFPKGSGNTPVLGVRRSDALAFCAWLTARDKEGWYYRLPGIKEWPIKEREQWKELFTETGYWTNDEAHLEWIQQSIDLRRIRFLDLDLASDLAHDLAHTRDLAHAFDFTNVHTRILASNLDLINNLASDIAGVHVRTRDSISSPISDLAYILSRTSGLAQNLDLTGKISLNHRHSDSFIDLSLVNRNHISADELAHFITNDHARDLIRTLNLAMGPISDRTRDLTHALDLTRDLAHDLASTNNVAQDIHLNLISARARINDVRVMLSLLQERREGRLPAYEGILLVKERQQRSSNPDV